MTYDLQMWSIMSFVYNHSGCHSYNETGFSTLSRSIVPGAVWWPPVPGGWSVQVWSGSGKAWYTDWLNKPL